MLRQGVLIWGTVRIADDTIELPVALAGEIQGGYMIVSTLAARNAIPGYLRAAGMIARVWNDPTPANNGSYELVPGTVDDTLTNNGNWINVVAPTSVTNKMYVQVDGTQETIVVDWALVLATFGNAPVAVSMYQQQSGGGYAVANVGWSIDAYPANQLTIYTNNIVGWLVIM